MNGKRLSSLVVSLVALWNLSAAAAWSQDSSCCGAWAQAATSGPSARSYTALAYDSARGKVVLYGGQNGNTIFGDTWEWDGASWKQVATAGPGPRAGHVLVNDSIRHRLLLFGGYDDHFVGQTSTWEWDGSLWTQVATGGPNSRQYAAAAFDSGRGRVVLFGGLGAQTYGDTWEWDGTTWTQVASTGPTARLDAAMAYDTARGRIVLFGGQPNTGAGPFADTWEWNGSAWTQVASTGPSARSGHAMVFADSCSQVLLFGGEGINGNDGDLWGWNGSSWTQQATTGPAARSIHAMTFDSGRSRTVLFGGQAQDVTEADTWELAAQPQIVTNNQDSGAGSLRDAIDSVCTGGTITFAATVVSPITLASELSIERSLTIQGPGANVLTISGNHKVRVFGIGETAPVTVTLAGLTIANGNVQVASDQLGEGGGILFDFGTLTLADSTLSGNSVGGGIEGFGGGIFNDFGTLNVIHSVLSGNSASSLGGGGGGSSGGAIFNFSEGTVTVANSTFYGNSANGVGGGGAGAAIANDRGGAVNITGCTLYGNSANGNAAFGGAIHNGAGTVTVTNSTLFGNAANGCDLFGCAGSGGAVYTDPGPGKTTFVNSTLAGNTASGYYGFCGGIYNGGATVSLQNTIVAGNTALGTLTRGSDVFNAFVSLGYNLIGKSDGSVGLGVNHDQLGTIAAPLDPRLDPNGLRDNGGPTPTLALLADSPAIDRGSAANDPVTGLPITTDQRGFARPIDDPGTPNPASGNLSDIGAFEFLGGGQPTISAVGLTLQQGSLSARAQIGTVSDPGQDSDSLTVTASPVAGSGVTLDHITIDAGGRVFGNVAVSCTATAASFLLTVTASRTLSASTTLTVAVTANTPPSLGSYPAIVGPINPGATVIVPPSAAPADNGAFTLTVSAPAFGGAISGSATTGVLTITGANPPGAYAATLKATDACGLTSTRSFTLLVNHPPTISGQIVSAQEGSPFTAPVTIAKVNDVEDAKSALRVSVNLGPSATVHGVTLSQIAVGPAGAVRASVVAACGASTADFMLRVTDSGGLPASALVRVVVAQSTPPTLGHYSSTHVRVGASTTVLPNVPPADNGGTLDLTARPSPPFAGGISVNPQSGAVSIFNARPVGNYQVTVTARGSCLATVRSFTLNVSPF